MKNINEKSNRKKNTRNGGNLKKKERKKRKGKTQNETTKHKTTVRKQSATACIGNNRSRPRRHFLLLVRKKRGNQVCVFLQKPNQRIHLRVGQPNKPPSNVGRPIGAWVRRKNTKERKTNQNRKQRLSIAVAISHPLTANHTEINDAEAVLCDDPNVRWGRPHVKGSNTYSNVSRGWGGRRDDLGCDDWIFKMK